MASCFPRAATTSASSLGSVDAGSAVSIVLPSCRESRSGARKPTMAPSADREHRFSGTVVRMAARQDPRWTSRYAIEKSFIPKDRYLSRDFFDMEMERLWPHVWQIACRADRVARPGDYLEYVIGDQSIL